MYLRLSLIFSAKKSDVYKRQVFDSVAYKNVISNGLVLDKNGNKMSKRLGNAVDPFGAIEQYGSCLLYTSRCV